LIAAATDASHAPMPTISLAAPVMTLAQLVSMSSHTCGGGGGDGERMRARVPRCSCRRRRQRRE
jgi:hypothetical protein